MSKSNGVTQRQREERARRKAMGIAVIQRPLKQIKRAHGEGWQFKEAAEEAALGNGRRVNQMARYWLGL